MDVSFINFRINHKNNISFQANPIPLAVSKAIDEKIASSSSVILLGHRSPDKDLVAAMINMAKKATRLGKEVKLVLVGELPKFFRPYVTDFHVVHPSQVGKLDSKALAVIVDLNSKVRLPDSAGRLLRKFKPEQVIGIDHHLANKDEGIIKGSTFYIDSSAKATCELVFQLMRGKRGLLDREALITLYGGFADDLIKSGYIKITYDDGKVLFNENKKMPDSTRREFKKLECRLRKELGVGGLNKLRGQLDVLANLSEAEQKFRDSLAHKIKFSPNKQYAEITIHSNDLEWQNIGQDNETTSAILNDFRRRILHDNSDAKAVITFYRGPHLPDKTHERYHMSIHSRDSYARTITDFVRSYRVLVLRFLKEFKIKYGKEAAQIKNPDLIPDFNDFLMDFAVRSSGRSREKIDPSFQPAFLTLLSGEKDLNVKIQKNMDLIQDFINKYGLDVKISDLRAGGHENRAGGSSSVQNSHIFVDIVKRCPELQALIGNHQIGP